MFLPVDEFQSSFFFNFYGSLPQLDRIGHKKKLRQKKLTKKKKKKEEMMKTWVNKILPERNVQFSIERGNNQAITWVFDLV